MTSSTSFAHNSTTSEKEAKAIAAEAIEKAKAANADAKAALKKAEDAKKERDDAVDQRNDAQDERDGARTERDNLAGEMKAYDAFMKRDRSLADERLVELTVEKAKSRKMKRQRIYFAGGGVIAGVLLGVVVYAVVDQALPGDR